MDVEVIASLIVSECEIEDFLPRNWMAALAGDVTELNCNLSIMPAI
jgi:hypothetical protein